jgi:hypothetical protein
MTRQFGVGLTTLRLLAVVAFAAPISLAAATSGALTAAALVSTPTPTPTQGYWEVASDGGIFTFGNALFFGSPVGQSVGAPIVGMAATPDGGGYFVAAANGDVLGYGDAGHLQPAMTGTVGVTAISDDGYMTATANGGVVLQARTVDFFETGDGFTHNKPIVGIALSPGPGPAYWLASSDGGVFSFGNAPFYGSLGAQKLNAPIVGIAATPDGKGYWLVAADGGVFCFGDAGFYGSMGNKRLNKPVVGLAPTPDAGGYWLAASDGGVFTFGDAGFYGAMSGQRLNAPITGIAALP